eukprot:TRINITY_DN188_c0_g1_i5.p3 TRINITY_DN188_c0_g1~~TRINITY_DN188_c0_g1_i5.p3  ORF type:complete len:142 (+),score=24.88 TRINITY_DN188_c0_g1_i5:210-635(+)
MIDIQGWQGEQCTRFRHCTLLPEDAVTDTAEIAIDDGIIQVCIHRSQIEGQMNEHPNAPPQNEGENQFPNAPPQNEGGNDSSNVPPPDDQALEMSGVQQTGERDQAQEMSGVQQTGERDHNQQDREVDEDYVDVLDDVLEL